MDDEKTLVIGSTGHLHVECVTWEKIASVNVVDFHQVVVAVPNLTDEFLRSHDSDFFAQLRLRFARLLRSGGEIIVLGDVERRIPVSDYAANASYDWSPVGLATKAEAGDTIIRMTGSFPTYFAEMKCWDFFFALPSPWITKELAAVCGHPDKVKCTVDPQPYLQNRYASLLAGRLCLARADLRTGEEDYLGAITLLPSIVGLETRAAVACILEDLLHLPQVALPPEWADTVLVPGVETIDAAIASKQAAIDVLTKEIEREEEKKHILNDTKQLLYASGTELEERFATCLEQCGGKVVPAKYSREEFILHYKDEVYLVECKGVSKSAALTHIRQIYDYMTKFEEDEGRKGKGILFVNAWRDLPLAERKMPNTAVFPENVAARAIELKVAAVSSVDFFEAYCHVLRGDISGEEVLDLITGSIGVVAFPKD